jgi:hypothetical protein
VAAAVWGSAGSRSRQLLNKLQQLWELTPWHDKANAVLWSTGPMLLTSVYKVSCCVAMKCIVFNFVVNEMGQTVLWSTGPMLLTSVYKVSCCVVL